MIRAVLFDLMGTLLVSNTNESPKSLTYLHTLLGRHGIRASEEEFMSIWESEQPQPSEKGNTPFEERIANVVYRLNRNLDWPEIKMIANNVCDRAATFLSVDSDIRELFRRLSRIVKIGLVTNYDHPPAIYKILRIHKLTDWFKVVVISGEIGIWKPDPEIMSVALHLLTMESSECIYVGDSSVDVEVAVSAEIIPVIIRRSDYRIDPFKEQEDTIEERFSDLINSGKLHIIGRLSEIERIIQTY